MHCQDLVEICNQQPVLFSASMYKMHGHTRGLSITMSLQKLFYIKLYVY